MGDREEGELSEEGELPEEPQEGGTSHVQASETVPTGGGSAPAAQQQPAKPKPTTLSRPRPEAQRREQAALAAEREARERAERERRGSGAGGGAAASGQHREPQQAGQHGAAHHAADRHKAEREKAELVQELQRLTRDLSFQDIRSNWETACADLKNAIKKLDKLLRRTKRKREDDVELYPQCHEFAGRICTALKHVIVICSTGLGRLADMELATNLVRAAMNYRHEIFSLTQKRDLEQAIRDSREFKSLFTDRDKAKSSKAAADAAAQQPAGEQQRVPLARGASSGPPAKEQQQQQQKEPPQQRREQLRSREQQAPGSLPQPPLSAGRSEGMQTSTSRDEAVSEASHAAGAGATSSRGGSGAANAAAGAPPSPPPAPPAPPPPAEAPGAGDGQPPPAGGAPGSGSGSGGGGSAALGGSRQPAPAGAAGSGGARGGMGHIKIVISSTSVGAGADAAAAAGGGTAAAGPGGANGAAWSGSGSGSLKRPLPAIDDLEAYDDAADDQQQQAKRARQQQQQHGEPQQQQLADHPDVQAAMANPSQLQAVLQRLLGARRLVLVLDLDHTLVNSTKFTEVDADWEYKLEQLASEQLSRPREARDLHRLARVAMWTKLRPGVREFLARAAARFELWIYTAGSRAYADAMVELLDPSGAYFGSRVIAQGGTAAGMGGTPGDDAPPAEGQLTVKRLMQGLEGCEPVVLIVDDSSAVWPHDRANLFVVERYVFFPSSRRRFGMAGKSLLEIDRDECPRRGMLMSALRVFEALHSRVFQALAAAAPPPAPGPPGGPPPLPPPQAWDVRAVMAEEKQQVLAGVVLVFSRVIPLEADARSHPLWQLAQQFGATCSEACSDATTHVVATHGGTEKVMWAKANNKHVVSPAWLECSCILWQRAAEQRFPTPY